MIRLNNLNSAAAAVVDFYSTAIGLPRAREKSSRRRRAITFLVDIARHCFSTATRANFAGNALRTRQARDFSVARRTRVYITTAPALARMALLQACLKERRSLARETVPPQRYSERMSYIQR